MTVDAPVILHADGELVVSCKSVGCECEHELPALLAELLHCKAEQLYCVHRLDRAVGGVMVYARTARAAAALSRQIQEGRFRKEYLAVCAGIPTPAEAELRDFLFKDSLKQKSFVVSSPRRGVKEAVLRYRVLETAEVNGASASLLRVALETGRFHQIRCQLASRGHPLLGDGKYGSRERGCTVALWSCRLSFRHPRTGEALTFTAPPPALFPWNGFGDAANAAGLP